MAAHLADASDMNDRPVSSELDGFDVVVVGAGAAGTVAAIEAADGGARVLVLDRWGRGGASARSGGIIYAGGGTTQQLRAGFADDPDRMARYLELEEGSAADTELISAFCGQSRDNLAWLEALGIAFPLAFDPQKSVTPTDDDVGLYFSGNERHYGGATPAIARGHRVAGVGMTGRDLMTGLHRAARQRGIVMRDGVRLVGLMRDDDGRVTGVEVLALDHDRGTRLGHRVLYRVVDTTAALVHRVPRRLQDAVERWERSHGTVHRVAAPHGVVLATGGFVYNHGLLAASAPAYAGTMPLGTPGDDGSALTLAQAAGAATRLMERCGASRFIAPPLGFCRGVLVDDQGERICDETLYAATLSARIAEHGSRAWLIVDGDDRDQIAEQVRQAGTRALRRLRRESLATLVGGRLNHLLFPVMFGSINLWINRVVAPDLDALARRCGLPPDRFVATIERYNADVVAGRPDLMDKSPEHVRPLTQPPFAAVACHLDSVVFPAPCITLGGLDVDASTQAVKAQDGSTIAGLYAGGRCAAGVASASYVSGLSLADCVFSGRNAGRAVTTRRTPTPTGLDRPEPTPPPRTPLSPR